MKPKSLFFLVMGATLLGAQLLAQDFTANLPQIADGALIRTTFVFFNNGSEDAEVTLSLTDDDGAPLSLTIGGLGEGSVHTFSLEPGQTRFFTTDGRGDNRAGAARVLSDRRIGVSAIFSLAPGGVVLTEAGVGASPEVEEFVVAVDTTGDSNTGIAIQDLSGSQNEVRFTVSGSDVPADDSGPLGILEETVVTLAPGGHLAMFVSGQGQLFPGLSQFQGRMVVRASAPVAAVTLRQNTSELTPLTTLPVVAADSAQTEFALPQIANGESIKTQFVLFGLGSPGPAGTVSGDVTLTLTDDEGAPFDVNLSNGMSGSSFTLPIDSLTALFLETDGQGELVAGAARVSSEIPIGVSAVFTLDLPGQPTTEAGVGDSPAFQELTLPADLAPPFDTGVALFNNNAETANVSFQFIDQDGTLLEAQSLEVSPFATSRIAPSGAFDSLGGFGHRARFVGQLLPGVDVAGRRGQFSVISDLPLSALTLRQSSVTLTTLPIEPGVADVGPPQPGPEGTQALPMEVAGVDLSADFRLDQALPAGFRIDGSIDAPAGVFPGSVVAVRQEDGEVYIGAVEPFGNYAVNVPAGTFDLRFCSFSGFQYVGTLEENVVVTENVTRNVAASVPASVSVSGALTNFAALPVLPGATGLVVFEDQNSLNASFALLDQTGAYMTRLAAGGDYRVSVTIISGEDQDGDGMVDEVDQALLLYNIDQFSAGADMAGVDFTVPPLAKVSGTVSQPQTTVFPENSSVFALDGSFAEENFLRQCFPSVGGGLSVVNPDGSYDPTILANRDHGLFAAIPVTGVGSEQEGFWSNPAPPGEFVNTSVDRTVNFDFPEFPGIVTLSGQVTDGNGVPLLGVGVAATAVGGINGAPDTGFATSATTAADGTYAMEVLSGTDYTVTFTPPPPMLTGQIFASKER